MIFIWRIHGGVRADFEVLEMSALMLSAALSWVRIWWLPDDEILNVSNWILNEITKNWQRGVSRNKIKVQTNIRSPIMIIRDNNLNTGGNNLAVQLPSRSNSSEAQKLVRGLSWVSFGSKELGSSKPWQLWHYPGQNTLKTYHRKAAGQTLQKIYDII